uniref:NAD(P)-dependent oxidoreductase n=1 Tax=Ignavibacterium album TaxID=591197 RepID=A0A832G267_9BACT
MKRILVTGAAGYIGSVVVKQLLNKGYFVRGIDILNFGGEALLSVYNHPNFEFIKGDLRNEDDVVKSLKEVDGVIHLAAIVGDPACAKEPQVAEDTNWKASKLLFDNAQLIPSVKRFVFASTCSNYGKMPGDNLLNEDSDLNPVSLYAKLKVKFEKYVLESETRKDFVPTTLRFATAYGLSPRVRFDLTVNEFSKEVALERELVIFGEQFWRPYCHVEDLASACILAMESEPKKVNHRVFNVGDSNENYQKKMIADEILKFVPSAKIKYVHKDEDPRDYKVDFSRIKNELGFKISRTVPQGLQEIYSIVKNGIIKNPDSKQYINI